MEEEHGLRQEVEELLVGFLHRQLTDMNPFRVDRVRALLEEAGGDNELRALKAAVQYALASDARSLAFLERTALNWLERGVPRWALSRIDEAGYQVDRSLAKELGWYVPEEEELDISQDKYYRFFRRE